MRLAPKILQRRPPLFLSGSLTPKARPTVNRPASSVCRSGSVSPFRNCAPDLAHQPHGPTGRARGLTTADPASAVVLAFGCISLTLPPRLLAAGLEAEACDAFARIHARFPGLPIRCDAGGADALQQPILRVICGSSLRVSLAVYGVADFAPLAAFVAVNALVIGGRSNKIGPAEVPSLASALEKMPQLTSLDLQGARIELGEAWSVSVCGMLRGFVLWALDALRCGVLSACGRA